LNNCLPLFPGGTMASKFSEDEILGLLEWAVPQTWRNKFDLDGYVPSMDSKAKFITECEAMERHQATKKGTDDDDNNNKKQKAKNSKSGNSGPTKNKSEPGKVAVNSFYCRECGRNPSHNTDKCFKIKNREQKASPSTSSATLRPTFSKRTFRKEVNSIMRKAGKKNVLGIMAASLKRAQAKDAKRVKKDSAKTDVSSDDESDESIHGIVRVIDGPIPRKKVATVRDMNWDDESSDASVPQKSKGNKKEKASRKRKAASDPTLEEETAFLKKVTQAEAEENASDSESSDSE
jgi:hypothetical protein